VKESDICHLYLEVRYQPTTCMIGDLRSFSSHVATLADEMHLIRGV